VFDFWFFDFFKLQLFGFGNLRLSGFGRLWFVFVGSLCMCVQDYPCIFDYTNLNCTKYQIFPSDLYESA